MPRKNHIHESTYEALNILLDNVRDILAKLAGTDSDLLFYANRFIYSRLQLDERKGKDKIRKDLYNSESGSMCSVCKKRISVLKGTHLHRIDDNKGYSLENCILLHPQCHIEIHKKLKHSRDKRDNSNNGNQLPKVASKDSGIYLSKYSKRYDKSYTYWWDIGPPTKGDLNIGEFRGITFVQKDTGLRCSIDSSVLLNGELLSDSRKTNRGKGNWGVKVLRTNTYQLIFEAAHPSQKTLFIDVVWVNEN